MVVMGDLDETEAEEVHNLVSDEEEEVLNDLEEMVVLLYLYIKHLRLVL